MCAENIVLHMFFNCRYCSGSQDSYLLEKPGARSQRSRRLRRSLANLQDEDLRGMRAEVAAALRRHAKLQGSSWQKPLFFAMIAPIPYRGVAQLVEHRSPKPGVAGSSPVSPAMKLYVCQVVRKRDFSFLEEKCRNYDSPWPPRSG